MSTVATEQIIRAVRDTARRCRLFGQLRSVGLGILAGAICCLVYLLAVKLVGVSRGPWTYAGLIIPVVTGLAAGIAYRRRMGDYRIAKLIDDQLGLQDQFASAYSFVENQRADVLAGMVIEEAVQEIGGRKVARESLPFHVSPWLWAAVGAGVICLLIHAKLFPPLVKETLAAGTQRELASAKESLAGLVALQANITDEEQKQNFERMQKLLEDLNLMSEGATKEEILARLSREVGELELKGDDELAQTVKEVQERISMGTLMDEVQKELDKGAEELAVKDAQGKKVVAENIATLALVEKKAIAKKSAENEELAKDLTKVAKEQTAQEKAKAEQTTWNLAKGAQQEEAEAEPEQEGAPKKKEVTALTYKALGKVMESRNIQELILTAARDKVRSSAQYREVYANYKRIMESMLYQESIPLGQQMYINRYFKVIEPNRQPEPGQSRL